MAEKRRTGMDDHYRAQRRGTATLRTQAQFAEMYADTVSGHPSEVSALIVLTQVLPQLPQRAGDHPRGRMRSPLTARVRLAAWVAQGLVTGRRPRWEAVRRG